jgi:phosphocarrier protein FPr
LNFGLFRAQIRAILRVKPHGAALIMLPMVSLLEEVKTLKSIIREEQTASGTGECSMGIMIETPSAALMAAQFAAEVDFFSIGTNDLAQYTLAMDRGHTKLAPMIDALHPAVLKLISMTAEGAVAHDRPVGVCGAMASELNAVPLLIGLGVRNLAVETPAIADIKALIRTLDVPACQKAALEALNAEDGGQVREIVKKCFNI